MCLACKCSVFLYTDCSPGMEVICFSFWCFFAMQSGNNVIMWYWDGWVPNSSVQSLSKCTWVVLSNVQKTVICWKCRQISPHLFFSLRNFLLLTELYAALSELSCLLDCAAYVWLVSFPHPIWSPSRLSPITCSDHQTRLSARCPILTFGCVVCRIIAQSSGRLGSLGEWHAQVNSEIRNFSFCIDIWEEE